MNLIPADTPSEVSLFKGRFKMCIRDRVYINLPNGGNQASVDISPNFNSRRITLRGELLPLSEGNIFQGRTF